MKRKSSFFKGDKISRILTIVGFIIFLLFVVLASVFYLTGANLTKSRSERSLILDEMTDWTLIDGDGNASEVELPVSVPTEDRKRYTIVSTLPKDTSYYTALDFCNSVDADLYIDGRLRYQFNPPDSPVFDGGIKQFHTLVSLKPEDGGKEIRIVTRPIVGGTIYLQKVYVGTGLGLMTRIIDANLMFFILSAALVIIATIVVLIGIVLRIMRQDNALIIPAGATVLFISLWLVFNSELYQFFYHNSIIGGIMANLMLLMVGYPIMAYLNVIQEGRFRRAYAIVSIVCEVLTVGIIVHHFVMDLSYRDETTDVMAVLLIVVVTCSVCLIKEVISKHFKEYKLSFIGTIILLVYTIVEFIMYMAIPDRHVGTGLMVGAYVWIGLAIMEQLDRLSRAKEAEKEALNASEAKSNFLANMSHEIRTPMNAILGMDEIIIREARGNEKILKYAGDIQSAGNMLLSIINDILDLSKIESGKAELVTEEFGVVNVIRDVGNITRSRATDKGLSYYIYVSPDIPKQFVGDEIRVRQIMLNVINNAIKYTKDGYVEVDIKYDDYNDDLPVKELIVAVKDTGIGIREEDKAEMFQSFSRLEVTRNRKIEGTGLGLTITTKYLDMMHGGLDLESEYGKGSTFTIHIPLDISDAEPIGDIRDAVKSMEVVKEYIPKVMAPNARLLVVDDNEMNLDVIDGLLLGTKIRVDNAISGADGLELVAKKHYDLIFLDQMMPEMDGTTTMKKMKEMGVEAPIIVLTADAGAKNEYLGEGFNGFVAKPVEGAEIESVLDEYLPDNLKLSEDEIRQIVEAEKYDEKQDVNPVSKSKILVIDDDPEYLKKTREALEARYDGSYVKDMEKAKKYLSKHEVDYVVFKDLHVIEKEDKG